MANIFETVSDFYRTHRKGIRTACFAVGVGCTIATPILASAATDRVKKKIETVGATTKKEIWDIAKKEPLVWATVGTTLGSVGFGGAAYGMGNKIIKLTESSADKIADQLSTTTEAISKLPEKQKDVIDKAIAETEVKKRIAYEDSVTASGDVVPESFSPVQTGYGDTLFYDVFTQTWFYSSFQKIESVVNEINDALNHGAYSNGADWAIKNGFKPREELYNDYWFMNLIELVKDGDHFYKMDSKGQPFGVIAFKLDSKPKHLSVEEARGLPTL